MNSLQSSAFNLAPPPTLQWQPVQIANFTAVAGRAYPCNTTSAAFTVTLPASPAAGNVITLTDYAGTWGTNNLTINPNGLKINSSTVNVTLSTNRGSVQLVYLDSTQGWVAYSGFAVTTLPQSPPTVEYLVIAGGGSSSVYAGGGGAGGYRTNVPGQTSGGNSPAESSFSVASGTSYTVTIGAGSTSGSLRGNNSVFGSITSTGGGTGNSQKDGGSGAGGGANTISPAAGNGTAGQGSNGGSGSPSNDSTAGGGGAGAVGANNGGGTGGAGGAGLSNNITGTAVTRAGGGGGGGNSAGGAGGSGGGGNGVTTGNTAGVGAVNTGSGGGSTYGAGTPGNGGSGVVIIAYPNTFANLASVSAGLTCNGSAGNTTPNTSSRAGYKVYVFTAGTGTISW